MQESWVQKLDEEEQEFLKRFVLMSGSLKLLAKSYDISYPTVRLRLDRLIEKLKVWESQDIKSEFERALLIEFAEGRITMTTLKNLRAAYKKDAATESKASAQKRPPGQWMD
jgi:hypothetical protein